MPPTYQTIANREINVSMKLGNRADLNQPAVGSGNTYSRIDGWLRDAYISIAYARTFEQTEQTISFNTVPGNDTYPYPTTVRAIKSLVGLNQQTGASVIVDWKDMNYVRRYSVGNQGPNQPYQGTPSIVAAWANTLVFRPFPDQQPYLFWLDCWMKPVIAGVNGVPGLLNATQLLVPDDWLEVIDYEAAMRGHAELLERDKAHEIAALLNGWVEPDGSKTIGLIERLQNRAQAQAPYKDWGMQPKFKPQYTR
jgi:hypothetical protein